MNNIMKKIKYITLLFIMLVIMLIIPNISRAAEISVTRSIYSNNGSMKFDFKGLTLDTTHEYEYGLTETAVAEVREWHLITEYTKSTAVVDVMTTTKDLREVINAVDTGYITIKDKTSDTVVLQPYSVNLKTPFLNVTNYTVIPNGKDLHAANIQIALRCATNSQAYYQYEKITDTRIINKYKEIKAKDGNVMELESMLKTTVPNSNWSTWEYWNGYDSLTGMNGYGFTQKNVSVPDSGLYYMWVYFSGNSLKNVYGYILVDNLQPDITLESISLPKTEKVELGKTLTLTPTFNPTNATNKIVNWSSSDETVATIDNGGKITPKKIGSTIITVTSQDGNRKATCTVTVVETSSNNKDNNNNNGTNNNGNTNNNGTNNNGSTNNSGTTSNGTSNNSGADGKKGSTMAIRKLPKAGVGIGAISTIVSLIGSSILAYVKYNKFKGM